MMRCAIRCILMLLCIMGMTGMRSYNLFWIRKGLSEPKSMLYDERNDRYLISNINGSPTLKDDNGYISVVSPKGRMEALHWIDGTTEDVTLNAPKGMAIRNEILYVTDIDRVRRFDLKTGKSIGDGIIIPDALFLNDMVLAKDDLLITDTGASVIYRMTPENNVSVFSRSIPSPNGISVSEEGVIQVVTFSKTGQLYTLNSDGTIGDIFRFPSGNLGGIVHSGSDTLLISSWRAQGIYQFKQGKSQLVLDELTSPADIGYDTERDVVLIPLLTENKCVAVQLKK